MTTSPDLTDYHAKYYAYELTKRYSADSLEKLASTFAGAKVDLNPHQLDSPAFDMPLMSPLMSINKTLTPFSDNASANR